uniref:Uncharacterized protein n=1 Tax=Anguilla anguilla TaxID=7936 RepID=A0A0E9U7C9_ANGAN
MVTDWSLSLPLLSFCLLPLSLVFLCVSYFSLYL